MFSSMLVAGITLQIGIQVLINIGVATSSIPNTGLPLPFISYGGTSLVLNLLAMGIVLNISRYDRRYSASARVEESRRTYHKIESRRSKI